MWYGISCFISTRKCNGSSFQSAGPPGPPGRNGIPGFPGGLGPGGKCRSSRPTRTPWTSRTPRTPWHRTSCCWSPGNWSPQVLLEQTVGNHSVVFGLIDTKTSVWMLPYTTYAYPTVTTSETQIRGKYISLAGVDANMFQFQIRSGVS